MEREREREGKTEREIEGKREEPRDARVVKKNRI